MSSIETMAIDAVKIPQNVYVEDRIIGPVTLRQLIITGLGAGVSYAIFATVSQAGITNVVALGACWIPAVIAAAFSFLKINDLTLFNIILLMIEGMNKPKKRTWEPGMGLSINIITKASKKKNAKTEGVGDTAEKAPHADRIAELTQELQAREEQLRSLTAQSDVTAEQNVRISDSEGSALPVKQGRIQTDELQAHLSLDGIMPATKLHQISLHNRL